MSSTDEEAPSPVLGASRSKDHAPVTPLQSESESDDGRKKKAPKYKRPRVEWTTILNIPKGADAEMDEDDLWARVKDAAREFMEASKVFKIYGHKSSATDLGMWKMMKFWPADSGTTEVRVFKCPLAGRFGCKCEMKVTEAASYVKLEKRGVHDEDCHHPDKDRSKHLKWKQIEAIRGHCHRSSCIS